MNTTARAQLADELVRRFAAAYRAGQLYSKGHPIIARNLESFSAAVQLLHSLESSVVLGIVGDEIIVDDQPLSKGENLGGLVRRLKQIAVERITIDRGVTADEIATLADAVTHLPVTGEGAAAPFPALPHIRVGRVTIEQRIDTSSADMATLKRLYGEAVSVAETIWESARTESQPDITVARTMIDGLAQAVSQNRTALLALTTLKNYDNYTFTHMVNVSILTMGQARGLAVEPTLLREFGLAALMHDIGKVRTPLEILNKPDKLTDDEFVIMRRHVIDGAEILRGTPDMPTLAPVVAFEHHLRLDGSGYPGGVHRPSLNLATQLCSIADVYDAMRSQRQYQNAHPSDRILEVLKRGNGHQFDQHLVRRFTQLIGIYPAGAVVRLDTGEIGVVVKVHAPDPYRPQTRIVADTAGHRLDFPVEVNLWEMEAGGGRPSAIVAAVDPATVDVDPLALLQ
jgi:putative nucleotidyltransferase with HDIG domain